MESLENHWQERRFKLGFTGKELAELLKELGVTAGQFKEKFGVNTCSVDEGTGEILYYFTDVADTLQACLEGTDRKVWD